MKWSLEGTLLKCSVEDNGVGRTKAASFSAWKPDNHHASGLKTIQERIEILNAGKLKNEQKNDFKIVDLYDEKGKARGTRVEISLAISNE